MDNMQTASKQLGVTNSYSFFQLDGRVRAYAQSYLSIYLRRQYVWLPESQYKKNVPQSLVCFDW